MVKKAVEAKPNHLLRAARKERNWTQKDVADRIGASQSFNVSRWEQGTAFPSAHYIQQLCLLFGKSAKKLGLLLEEPHVSGEPTTTEADSSPLWNVPYRRNPFFTGREEMLTQLHDRLTASKTVALTQAQAITGLGGIGKTQIALEYAYRHRESYRYVFWVRAASADALISDFVTLASLLRLSGQDEQDQNRVVAAVKGWLASQEGWLLILDNADDLELAVDFLPPGNKGHILLTTRTQATGGIAYSIAVEKMEQSEGAQLLLRRAQLLIPGEPIELVSERERSQAQAIVEAMDGLPLALDQAGAYIEETGCGLAGYLELYRTNRLELLQRRSTLPSDHPEPVAATWALSFLKVEQANPAAADLLRLCAFLNPDAILETMLAEGASTLGSLLGTVVTDPFELNRALEVLRKFSLLRRHPDAKMLTIHRLVQAVLKDRMDEQTQWQWAERAVRAVNQAFPEVDFENWTRCQQYLPQVYDCAKHIEQYKLIFPEAARLLTFAGRYLNERALFTQAELFLRHALLIQERVSGPQNLETASSLSYLAKLYRDQGKYGEAEPLFQRASRIQEHVLGPEDPALAFSLNGLATLYYYQGRYEEAEPLFQRALRIREQGLGPQHPEVGYLLANLGNLYCSQGKYAEAEPLYQRALHILEQQLGAGHPKLGNTLNGLAGLYLRQGKYQEAEILYQRALSIQEQRLGPQHIDVAYSLTNLAELYLYQGRYEEAEPLYQRAVSINEQALGSDHPNLAYPLDGLAALCYYQGRYEEAEPLYQRALHVFEQRHGPPHPDMTNSLCGLANLYYDQGKYEESELLYRRTLCLFDQCLGLQRLSLAQTLIHLASFFSAQGKNIEAASLYQRVLAIQEKTLGLERVETLATQAKYNNLLKEMKQLTETAKIADSD